MNAITEIGDGDRYARCIKASKSVRWDIETDVIQGRRFLRSEKYLPDGLSLVAEFTTLDEHEKRFVSQIQGRTYANVFGLSSASSMPRCWRSAANTGSAIRWRSRRWSGSAMRNSSTKPCSAGSMP